MRCFKMESANRIYANGQLTKLIAEVPNEPPLIYEQHDRKEGKIYTYFIVSVDALGGTSEPVVVRVPDSTSSH